MPTTQRDCHTGVVPLRTVIVDDNPEFLAAARDLLTREQVDVVGLASSAAEAVRLVGDLRPEVALVDVYLGPDNGFDLARELAAGNDGFRPAVILISTYAEKDLDELIAASPAAGFVSKSDLSRAAIDRVLGLTDPS
jgi:DNA-binding NarL/FixJ family response regulator